MMSRHDWRRYQIAPDRRHHEVDGTPAYAACFDAVGEFREPGLAPVSLNGLAWHITAIGEAAYSRRFRAAYGFYQSRAAVCDGHQWFHILPSGEDAYSTRWRWCGNFREHLCVVANDTEKYLHIDANGRPAYSELWDYAGDFSEGAAAVTRDGKATHIDAQGQLLHGRWYRDVGAFHKGYAIAQDEDGYCHIDRSGKPIYAYRFASLDHFYNGRAHAVRHDGARVVIDPSGTTVATLAPPTSDSFMQLSHMLVGYWSTCTIHAAMDLGVFEGLPGTVLHCAERAGIAPDVMERLLGGLAELKLVHRFGDMWDTTTLGALLKREHPWSLAPAVSEYATILTDMWRELPVRLRTPALQHRVTVFDRIQGDAQRVQRHHAMLASYARHDYRDIPRMLDLSDSRKLIDAGGGSGVLASLLAQRWPHLEIVILERPEVVAQQAPHQARIAWRQADLLEPWPVTGDTVILARVLHDFDDDTALKLLRHAHAALPCGGRLVVVEMLLDEGNARGRLCDLHVLAATGGRERTCAAYTRLLLDARFIKRSCHALPPPNICSMLVAEAV